MLDADDNCPEHDNADQADTDRNGVGDACEACALGDDSDGDGVVDGCDVCPGVGDDQSDSDADSIGDACDDSDGDGIVDGADNCPRAANGDQADRDGDAIGDACGTYEVGFSDASSSCRGGALGWGLLPLIGLIGWRLRRRSRV